MNIKQAQAEFNAAKSIDTTDAIGKARRFLAAQRMAAQCRAKSCRVLEGRAHYAVAFFARQILAASNSHHQRSEAGQIIRESDLRFFGK